MQTMNTTCSRRVSTSQVRVYYGYNYNTGACYPGAAGGCHPGPLKPAVVLVVLAGAREIAPAAPGRHEGEDREEQQVVDEVVVVAVPDTVPNPGAVVVEPGHALVAHAAVLGSERPPHQTAAAEDGRVEAAGLGQLDQRAILLGLAGPHHAGIRPPGPQEAHPQPGPAQDKYHRAHRGDEHLRVKVLHDSLNRNGLSGPAVVVVLYFGLKV